MHAATEGWAIGVAALAKSDRTDSRNGHYLFASYFEEQVWGAWDDQLRSFCLATSVAEEYDPTLAALLSGRDDAREVMERLTRTNTFLSRLHGDTYRYHHLFRDFLREKAAEAGVDRVVLCKRAAEHFRDRHDYTRALRFWFESGDFSGMDTYLLLFLFENARGCVDYADFLRTLDIESLPADAYGVCPPLRVLAAWYFYLTSQRTAFEHHLDELYRALPHIAASDSRFMEFALLAYSVDHRTTIIEKARKFSLFGRFVKRFTPAGLATEIASFTHNLPYPHRSNVDYSAIVLEDGGMELIGRTFAPLLGAEWGYVRPLLPACFAYERNRLDEALAGLRETEKALRAENREDGRACIMVMKHATLWQMERESEAAAALDDLVALHGGGSAAFPTQPESVPSEARAVRCGQARSACVAGRVLRHRRRAHRVRALVPALHHRASAHPCSGRRTRPNACWNACARSGGRSTARSTWARRARSWRRCCGPRVVGPRLWTADRGDGSAARAFRVLPRGGRRGRGGGAGAEEPGRAYFLARSGYDGPLERAFVQEAYLAAHDRARRFRGVCANLGVRTKPVKLSPQQKRVLELLARGLRNSEIAAETGLSLPTVKSHVQATYRKLDVHAGAPTPFCARESWGYCRGRWLFTDRPPFFRGSRAMLSQGGAGRRDGHGDEVQRALARSPVLTRGFRLRGVRRAGRGLRRGRGARFGLGFRLGEVRVAVERFVADAACRYGARRLLREQRVRVPGVRARFGALERGRRDGQLAVEHAVCGRSGFLRVLADAREIEQGILDEPPLRVQADVARRAAGDGRDGLREQAVGEPSLERVALLRGVAQGDGRAVVHERSGVVGAVRAAVQLV